MDDPMLGVNAYGNSLSLNKNDLNTEIHRKVVGGLWEELGKLQLDFMIAQGLQQNHKLLDLGCGCLRGGVKFIDYLSSDNYVGIDINQSLPAAGQKELENHHLVGKSPLLLRSDNFGSELDIGKFDFAISVSLFTHLPSSYVQEALLSLKYKLNEKGAYFATFFVADDLSQQFSSITHSLGNITSYPHKDPFHVNTGLVQFISNQVGLKCSYIGDWHHPRDQKMYKFEHA